MKQPKSVIVKETALQFRAKLPEIILLRHIQFMQVKIKEYCPEKQSTGFVLLCHLHKVSHETSFPFVIIISRRREIGTTG
nr:hypothetical protein Iba_chr15aCG9640 [Ipomoea batatas]